MTLSDQLKGWLTYATFGILLVVLTLESTSNEYGVGLALLAVLLFGIPHGATDHILFRHINKDFGKGFLYRFLVRYLLLMGIFILAWWIFPSLALLIFLAISAYHFGQSHWDELEIGKRYKIIIYGFWGGNLIVSLLMINHSETLPIINSMVGEDIIIPLFFYSLVPAILLLINIGIIGLLFLSNKLSLKSCCREVFTLLLFTLLFIELPLITGFAIYFVVWHSTLSIQDQISYFRSFNPAYNIKQFIIQSLPFTILAFVGIGGLSFFSSNEVASTVWIGHFFIMISIVTLPHSLLMDKILETQENINRNQLNKNDMYRKHKSLILPPKTNSKIS